MPTLPTELFRRLTTGVYVVSAAHGGRTDAFTAAWVTQVSFEPLLIALSVNPDNATWPLIQASGCFVVNILKSGQLQMARHFGTRSGREMDKLAGMASAPGRSGPVLADALGWLECRTEQHVPAGDHVVVIAQVVGGELRDPAAAPLQYRETGEMDGSASLYPDRFNNS